MNSKCRVMLVGNSSTASWNKDPKERQAQAIARPLQLIFFCSLLYIFTPFFSSSSSVSLSSSDLAIPIHKDLGEHTCTSSTFSIAKLNCVCIFCEENSACLGRNFAYHLLINLIQLFLFFSRGWWMIYSFFDCSTKFCFLLIEFHCTF